MDLQ
jgi:hypothetical protein